MPSGALLERVPQKDLTPLGGWRKRVFLLLRFPGVKLFPPENPSASPPGFWAKKVGGPRVLGGIWALFKS